MNREKAMPQNTDEPTASQALAVANDSEEAIDLGLDRIPRTDLARLVIAARREFLAAEGHFLDRHELERELAERRGGSSEDAGG